MRWLKRPIKVTPSFMLSARDKEKGPRQLRRGPLKS